MCRKNLVDSFGRVHDYLRISLTERCNLKCIYCMPNQKIEYFNSKDLLTTEEFMRIAGLFVDWGIKKIRITGGEPTIHPNFNQILSKFKLLKMEKNLSSIAITTNGYVTFKYLDHMIDCGVDSFNVSLDTLQEDKFRKITKFNGLKRVIKTIEELKKFPQLNVKVNCVVIKGINFDEIIEIIHYFKEQKIELRFIEFMPFSGNQWSNDGFVSSEEMINVIRSTFQIETFHHSDPKRSSNSTSKNYRLIGFPLIIGFISSMSNHFCGSCNRLRLSVNGQLRTCLFGKSELDFKTLIRNNEVEDDYIHQLVQKCLFNKKFSHAGMDFLSKNPTDPMVIIGG